MFFEYKNYLMRLSIAFEVKLNLLETLYLHNFERCRRIYVLDKNSKLSAENRGQ